MSEFDPIDNDNALGLGPEIENEGVAGFDNSGVAPEDGLDGFGFGDADEGKADGSAAANNDDDLFNLGAMGVTEAPEAPVEESDVYAKWQTTHEKALQAKAAALRAEKDKQNQAAKDELAAFYAKRDAAIKRQKAANVSNEKQWRSDINETNATGTQWQKVAKYCDLKPKAEGKGGQASKTERMRKILTSLKNEGQ